MNQVNPLIRFNSIATRLATQSAVRAAYRERHIAKFKNEVLDVRGVYQLKQGIHYGEIREMLGSEAMDENRVFKLDYGEDVAAEIEAGVPFGQTKSRMKRWIFLRKPETQFA